MQFAGLFHCSKYKSRTIFMASPQIIVFSNQAPDWDTLTGDRWSHFKVGVTMPRDLHVDTQFQAQTPQEMLNQIEEEALV